MTVRELQESFNSVTVNRWKKAQGRCLEVSCCIISIIVILFGVSGFSWFFPILGFPYKTFCVSMFSHLCIHFLFFHITLLVRNDGGRFHIQHYVDNYNAAISDMVADIVVGWHGSPPWGIGIIQIEWAFVYVIVWWQT